MKMHSLLAMPHRWTQRSIARDKCGVPCWDGAPEAQCWCLVGALRQCYIDQPDKAARAVSKLNEVTGPSISAWNDAPERTHAEVLELLRRLDV